MRRRSPSLFARIWQALVLVFALHVIAGAIGDRRGLAYLR